MPTVLSFGGGVNSVAMFLRWLEDGRPLDLVCFADTGDEQPGTLEVVRWTADMCAERGIAFETVRGGNLVAWHQENRVVPLPHRGFRSCTYNFKIAPLRAALRRRGWTEGEVLIGIAKDEAQRMKDSDVQWLQNRYPLVYDYGMTRADCLATIDRLWSGPPVEKSGCKGCPFIGPVGFLALARDDPETFARWRAMEEAARDYPENRLFVDNAMRGPTLAQIAHRAQTEQTLFDWQGVQEQECGGGCFT